MPVDLRACVDGWAKVMPDFEICAWNETNFDVSAHPYTKRMYDAGNFSFASDYARFAILERHGGIYLDTDMEVYRSLDEFRKDRAFLGFEHHSVLSIGVLGFRAGDGFVREVLKEFDEAARRERIDTGNAIATRLMLKLYPEFRLGGGTQIVGDGMVVYDKEYFTLPTWDTRKGYARHLNKGAWIAGRRPPTPFKAAVRKLIGDVLYFKLVSFKVDRSNEFSVVYREHRRRRR
jgi:hypothetical protein